MGLSWPTWRTEHLALLDVMRLDMAHWSSLCRSLYRTYRLTVPLNLVSPVNSLRVHLIPSFTSLIKMLKLVPILSPREHLWWPAANWTEFHSLWQFEPSQFFTLRSVHLPKSRADSFSRSTKQSNPSTSYRRTRLERCVAHTIS